MKYRIFCIVLLYFLSTPFLQAQQIGTSATPDWVKKINITELLDTMNFRQNQEYSFRNETNIYREVQINVDEEVIFDKKVFRIVKDQQKHNVYVNYSSKDIQHDIIALSAIRNGREVNITDQLNWSEAIANEYVFNKLWESRRAIQVTVDNVKENDLYTISALDKLLRTDVTMDEGWAFGIPDSVYINFRLISKKPINVTALSGFPQITTVQHEDYFEYKAQGFGLSPYQNMTPRDFISSPIVTFSKYNTIEESEESSIAYYVADEESKPVLDSLHQKLTEGLAADSSQIKNIINYVQDSILYQQYGLIRAYSPSWCIQGRRGDCKAKTLITLELLKRSGITGYPVLVNSVGFLNQLDTIPSVLNFDHVIVQFMYQGDTVLVDPTAEGQTDKIGGYPIPDYEKGLVLTPKRLFMREVAPRHQGKITICDTIAVKSVHRKLIATGEFAERYRSAEAGFSDGTSSLFESELTHIGRQDNQAICVFPYYDWDSDENKQVTAIEERDYNTAIQDSLVFEQALFIPDTIEGSILPNRRRSVSGSSYSSRRFGLGMSPDSLYTGDWPLEYINQTTSAVYIKEGIPFEDLDLEKVDTNFSLESDFGHYRCMVTEDEETITVKQDMLISGGLPASRNDEYETFMEKMNDHRRDVYNLLLAEEKKSKKKKRRRKKG
ncbi:MAG: hypothetical protein AAF740_02505 [Bacteroidota bacterium]